MTCFLFFCSFHSVPNSDYQAISISLLGALAFVSKTFGEPRPEFRPPFGILDFYWVSGFRTTSIRSHKAMVFAVSGFRTTSIRSHITSVREPRFHGSTRRMVQKRIYIYIYIYCGHPLTSLPIPTSPNRVMTGRPPPRGRSEGPPPRGRCRGFLGRRGGGNKKLGKQKPLVFW